MGIKKPRVGQNPRILMQIDCMGAKITTNIIEIIEINLRCIIGGQMGYSEYPVKTAAGDLTPAAGV